MTLIDHRANRTPFPDVAKNQVRIVTCGSVDDGKSTLIGRILWDCGVVHDDEAARLKSDSRKFGTVGKDALEFAFLLDGLQVEQEQGITIDVAHRFFESAHRRYVVTDSPGHEQYTRNMATAASNADVAIILVDAVCGLREQTQRHVVICHLMGIRHVVLAVNKMDLIGFDADRFETIASQFTGLTKELWPHGVVCIPISALAGDNVVSASDRMAWYDGPLIVQYLDQVVVSRAAADVLRFPVQWINRLQHNFRGYAGTIASGHISQGDRIKVLPSGNQTEITQIIGSHGYLHSASVGEAVTVVLKDEIDISRGNVIVAADDFSPAVADQLQAHIIWFSDRPLILGRACWLHMGTATAGATVMAIKHRLDATSREKIAATTLNANDIGVVTLALDQPLAFDPYTTNRRCGSFIIVDKYDNSTVAAGMVDHPLRRATNVRWRELDVSRLTRANMKGQRPACFWFTGLSGAGKSTIANALDRSLTAKGRHTYILDGDNIRHGLNRDLGFTENDRVENIRRIAEVAKLMVDAGLIVIVCAISPYRKDRDMARALFATGEFIEVFVDTPLAVCEARDSKGFYKKARAGEIPNFTGINDPYEVPERPEIHLNRQEAMVDQLFRVIDDRFAWL